jgi:hypothetical protein
MLSPFIKLSGLNLISAKDIHNAFLQQAYAPYWSKAIYQRPIMIHFKSESPPKNTLSYCFITYYFNGTEAAQEV